MTTAQLWILGLAALAVVLPVLYYWIVKRLYGTIERADEKHTVLTDDGWRIALFRYLPRTDGPREPVLLCHGAFANHHNFDIPAGSSLADYLAGAGYDVWLMDFRGDRSAIPAAGRKRSNATADEYLLEDMPAAIDYVLAETGCKTLHAVGHSMGGMFWMAYAVEFEGYGLASLTTIGAPVSFEGLRFHPHRGLIGLIGALAPVAEPIQRVLCSWVIALKWSSRVYPMNFANQPDGAGPREGFHKADLLPAPVAGSLDAWASTGDWRMVGGELEVIAELASIGVPWQMICGRRDGLTPPHHVENLAAQLPPRTSRYVMFSAEDGHAVDYGHIDLVIGRHSPNEVFPALVEWFAAHPAKGASRVAVKPEAETSAEEEFAHEEAMILLAEEAETFAAEEAEATRPAQVRRVRPAAARAAMDQPLAGEEDFEAVRRRRLGRAMDKARVVLREFADEDEGDVSLPGASLEDLERSLAERVKKAPKAKAKSKAKPAAKAKAPAKKKAPAKAKAPAAKKPAAKKAPGKPKAAPKKRGAK